MKTHYISAIKSAQKRLKKACRLGSKSSALFEQKIVKNDKSVGILRLFDVHFGAILRVFIEKRITGTHSIFKNK